MRPLPFLLFPASLEVVLHLALVVITPGTMVLCQLQRELHYRVVEETPSGTLVCDVMRGASFVKRYGKNVLDTLRFRFLNSPPSWLVIDERSGEVRTSGRLDREAVCPRTITGQQTHSTDSERQATKRTRRHMTHDVDFQLIRQTSNDQPPSRHRHDQRYQSGRHRDINARKRSRRLKTGDLGTTLQLDNATTEFISAAPTTVASDTDHKNAMVADEEGASDNSSHGQLSRTDSNNSSCSSYSSNNDISSCSSSDNNNSSSNKSVETKTRRSSDILSANNASHSVITPSITTGALLYHHGDHCQFRVDVAVIPLSHFTIVKVSITVEDTNDNSPTFHPDTVTMEMGEDSRVGQVWLPLPTAVDLDSEQFSVQRYIIAELATNGSDVEITDGHFQLNVMEKLDGTTEVRMILSKPLDREVNDLHLFKVIAYDGGQPPRSGSLEVRIKVTDHNDNPPVFRQSIYNSEVVENLPKGTSILTVSATDRDQGPNSAIIYSVVADPQRNEVLPFDINSTTGVVHVTGVVDHDLVSIYRFLVRAADGGQESLTADAVVVVVVRDVNDNPPKIVINTLQAVSDRTFEGNNWSRADQSGNGALGRGVAHDPGINRTNMADPTKLHMSDSGNSMSSSPSPINSHFTSPTIQSTSSTSSLSSRPTLWPPNVARVSENVPPGSFVAHVVVQDADSGVNGQFRCSLNSEDFVLKVLPSPKPLTPSAISSRLQPIREGARQQRLNEALATRNDESKYRWTTTSEPKSGRVDYQIVTGGQLDRESRDKYQLTVICSDSGSPTLSSRYDLSVDVVDENDVTPRFKLDIYKTEVTEDNGRHPVQLLQVEAVDEDSGNNGLIVYVISGEDDDDDDDDDDDEDANEENRTTETVYESQGGKQQRGNFQEKSKSKVKSKPLVRTSMATHFGVEPTTGWVFSKFPFNLEARSSRVNEYKGEKVKGQKMTSKIFQLGRPEYVFKVLAIDQGRPQRTGTATVHVLVRNINDEAPSFTKPVYTFHVFENLKPSQRVKGHAPDEQSPGIVEVTDRTPDPDFIDQYIDYAFQDYDSKRLKTTSSPGNAQTSGAARGGRKWKKENWIEIGKVLAVDPDGPPFDRVEYSVRSLSGPPRLNGSLILTKKNLSGKKHAPSTGPQAAGKSIPELFAVGPSNGVVMVTEPLDREQQDFHKFLIVARDVSGHNEYRHLESSATVIVEVMDVNDNAPVWIYPQADDQSATVFTSSLNFGSVIVEFKATDRDEGINAEVTYSIELDDPTDVLGNTNYTASLASPSTSPTLSTITDKTVGNKKHTAIAISSHSSHAIWPSGMILNLLNFDTRKGRLTVKDFKFLSSVMRGRPVDDKMAAAVEEEGVDGAENAEIRKSILNEMRSSFSSLSPLNIKLQARDGGSPALSSKHRRFRLLFNQSSVSVPASRLPDASSSLPRFPDSIFSGNVTLDQMFDFPDDNMDLEEGAWLRSVRFWLVIVSLSVVIVVFVILLAAYLEKSGRRSGRKMKRKKKQTDHQHHLHHHHHHSSPRGGMRVNDSTGAKGYLKYDRHFVLRDFDDVPSSGHERKVNRDVERIGKMCQSKTRTRSSEMEQSNVVRNSAFSGSFKQRSRQRPSFRKATSDDLSAAGRSSTAASDSSPVKTTGCFEFAWYYRKRRAINESYTEGKMTEPEIIFCNDAIARHEELNKSCSSAPLPNQPLSLPISTPSSSCRPPLTVLARYSTSMVTSISSTNQKSSTASMSSSSLAPLFSPTPLWTSSSTSPPPSSSSSSSAVVAVGGPGPVNLNPGNTSSSSSSSSSVIASSSRVTLSKLPPSSHAPDEYFIRNISTATTAGGFKSVVGRCRTAVSDIGGFTNCKSAPPLDPSREPNPGRARDGHQVTSGNVCRFSDDTCFTMSDQVTTFTERDGVTNESKRRSRDVVVAVAIADQSDVDVPLSTCDKQVPLGRGDEPLDPVTSTPATSASPTADATERLTPGNKMAVASRAPEVSTGRDYDVINRSTIGGNPAVTISRNAIHRLETASDVQSLEFSIQ